MNEFYFTTRDAEDARGYIIGFRQIDGVWRKHIQLPRRGEIVFSADGNRMHMGKGYRDRNGDGWSDLKSIGPLFDHKELGIMRLSPSELGTYVIDDYLTDVIRISSIVDGERQEPVAMSEIVNTGEWTAHPYISPDESYLFWDSEREVASVTLTCISVFVRQISRGVRRSTWGKPSIHPDGTPLPTSPPTANTCSFNEAWMTTTKM